MNHEIIYLVFDYIKYGSLFSKKHINFLKKIKKLQKNKNAKKNEENDLNQIPSYILHKNVFVGNISDKIKTKYFLQIIKCLEYCKFYILYNFSTYHYWSLSQRFKTREYYDYK